MFRLVKSDLGTSNNPKGESYEKKIVVKRRETWLKLRFLHKAIYIHLHKRKLLLPSPGLFLFLLDLHSLFCKTQKRNFLTAHIVKKISEVI